MPSRGKTIARRMPAGVMAAVLIILAIVLNGAGGAGAQRIVAPDTALTMAREGQVMIIDIRRPDEWRETGIPAGAERATVRPSRGANSFLRRIAQLTNGDKNMPIALICAVGVRSKHASRLLRSRGYSGVLDISEGMLGNGNGAGWLRRNLPVSSCKNCK